MEKNGLYVGEKRPTLARKLHKMGTISGSKSLNLTYNPLNKRRKQKTFNKSKKKDPKPLTGIKKSVSLHSLFHGSNKVGRQKGS